MNKSDWIEIHKDLLRIKNHIVQMKEDYTGFEECESLNVHPSHGHKSKSEHKMATYTLGSALTELMSGDEFSDAQRISNRLQGIADEFDQEFE